jgi:hypothetical protein
MPIECFCFVFTDWSVIDVEVSFLDTFAMVTLGI